ncbi:MAG: hypothetical protein N2200_02080 [Bacteroidia bacterium]|nr:hypothetical protein [Bacteroidia bacterium]
MYLLSRKTVAGGLSGAFIVLLGLGLWYGWRSATYLWALQWTIYAAGILLIWAWLALDNPLLQYPKRLQLPSAILVLAFLLWGTSETIVEYPRILRVPTILPTLSDIGIRLAHEWAVIFVWVSVTLSAVWLLLLLSWKRVSPRA